MSTIREVTTDAVRDLVYRLCLSACRELDPPTEQAIARAAREEQSEFGRAQLAMLMDNIACAREGNLPLCQDTGMAVVFADIGQDVHITGGALADAVDEGVRRAYKDGYFRASVLSALERKNTGDNTPAVLHVRIVPGDALEITVAPKGFGSENMSRHAMLTPSQGREGVFDFIVDTVRRAGGNPCPPVIVGVGIGGTFEQSALMAKRSLLRETGAPSHDPALKEMEEQLLARINRLGIGPLGLGGVVTALAVHIIEVPTHLAGLPVAVNIQCHCARHATGRV